MVPESLVLFLAALATYALQAVAGFLIVWWTTFVHEVGHFVAARLVGAEVHAVVVGNGAQVLTFRLFGVRWVLRPLVHSGDFGGYVECQVTSGKAFRARWAIILLAGPLLSVLAVGVVLWLLYVAYWQVEDEGGRMLGFPLLLLFGFVALAVLYQNFVPTSKGDRSSLVHDVTQLARVRAMSARDIDASVEAARGVVWGWEATNRVLAGDHSMLERVDPADLDANRAAQFHWLRTAASWDFEPDEVLESMDRYEAICNESVAERNCAVAGQAQRRAEDSMREAVAIHRAAVLAALHSRDPSRTDELARADELTEFVDSRRAPAGDLLHSRGLVLMQQGRLASARERLMRAFALPMDWRLRAYQAAYLATCCAREGRARDARYYWRKALSIDPESPAVRFFGNEVREALAEDGIAAGRAEKAVIVEWLGVGIAAAALVAKNFVGAGQSGIAAVAVALGVDLAYLLPLAFLLLLAWSRFRHIRRRVRDRRADFAEAWIWRAVRAVVALVLVFMDSCFGG